MLASGSAVWKRGIAIICIQGFIFQLVSAQDGRKFKPGKIRHDDHGPRHRNYRHVDLDYDKLLQSFGLSGEKFPVSSSVQPELTVTSTNMPLIVATNPTDCESLQCDRGRICRSSPSTGNPECICRPQCSSRRNPVCGSDGNWYHNHCELHRISCVENRPLHPAGSHKIHCAHISTDASILPHMLESITTPLTAREVCSKKDYARLKEKLLLYFYDGLTAATGGDTSVDKRQLLRAMLDEFDRDKNSRLDQKELESGSKKFENLFPHCNFDELLRNEDLNEDGFLNLNELLTAYGLADVSGGLTGRHHKWTVIAGNSIEIACSDSKASASSITWERNHVKLNGLDEETGLHINDHSGALYVIHAQLIHAGNYSCFEDREPDTRTVQTHSLSVLLTPEVELEFRQHFARPFENVTLKCHAVGLPTPAVKWLKNEEPIDYLSAKISGNSNQLILSNLLYKDTGVYTCMAENEAASNSAISSVFVVDQESREISSPKFFLVFYAKGIAMYEPVQCRPKLHIHSNDKIPGSSDLICGKDNYGCDWGSVVNVLDRYIYASQPILNRILVISIEQMMVVQVILTDKVPVKLSYVPHLDQLWILCWTSVEDTSSKTVQVVRDASVKEIHTAIHPEPIDGKYPTVADLFIPPVQELAHKFSHAYAVCSSQKALFKIDMRTLRFIRTVDLTPYACRPRKISYSSLGGFVFIDCNDLQRGTPNGQLVLDYLTDSVLHHDQSMNGVTFISPDSRYWINLGADVIRIQEITENGLVYLNDVISTFHIADVTFHPSQWNHSYDLYATALTKDHLLHVELGSNRLSTMSGIGFGTGRKMDHWGNADSRFLAYTGIFGSYLVSAAKSTVFVSNTVTRNVNCAIGDLYQPQHGIWVDRSFH